jgi:RHS repeat-associated protein
VTRKELGNGVVMWGAYDQADRVSSLRYAKPDGTAVAYFDYGWDAAGRIMRIAREDDLVVYYGYDDVDRLTGELWQKQSHGDQIYGFWYEYDAGHNRVKMRRESSAGVEAESAYYGYDEANALTQRAVWTPPSTQADTYYYYDENGSLVREIEGADTTYFEYGPHGLVTRIAPPSGNPWNFYYDGQLNRYCIDKGGQATYYLWDGLNLLEERAADGSLLARYTHGPYRQYGIGSVVEVERNAGGATYYQYLVLDHRGTAYKVADSEGATQLEYTLDAFGRQLAAPTGLDANVPNDLVYQTNWLTIKVGGEWYGLSRFRLYDPATGVFLRRDFLRHLNRYRAWSNSPIRQVDRDGLVDADTMDERPPPPRAEDPPPKQPGASPSLQLDLKELECCLTLDDWSEFEALVKLLSKRRSLRMDPWVNRLMEEYYQAVGDSTRRRLILDIALTIALAGAGAILEKALRAPWVLTQSVGRGASGGLEQAPNLVKLAKGIGVVHVHRLYADLARLADEMDRAKAGLGRALRDWSTWAQKEWRKALWDYRREVAEHDPTRGMGMEQMQRMLENMDEEEKQILLEFLREKGCAPTGSPP